MVDPQSIQTGQGAPKAVLGFHERVVAFGFGQLGGHLVSLGAAVPHRVHVFQLDAVRGCAQVPGPTSPAQPSGNAELRREPRGVHSNHPRPAITERGDHRIGRRIEITSEDQNCHTGCGASGAKSYT